MIMQSEDVIALIGRVREGDQQAFVKLLSQYEPLIHSEVTRFAAERSHEDVKDMRQVATVSLYRAAMNFDLSQSVVKFGLYAKVCVTNAIVSLLRDWAQKPSELSISEVQEMTSGEDLIAELMAEEATAALLTRIRALLSPFEWSVWVLHLSGYRSGEIARLLGKPAHSIENAVYRIRQKLRKKLGDLQ